MSSYKKGLSDIEILKIIDEWDESEDEFGKGDEFDDLYDDVLAQRVFNETPDESTEKENKAENIVENIYNELNINSNRNENILEELDINSIPIIFEQDVEKLPLQSKSSATELKEIKTKISKCIWKKKSFESDDEMEVAAVQWKDTKIVTLTSNFVGELPLLTSERREKGKGLVDVKCPSIVKEYNKFMGGVDLLDSLLERSKIKLKSRKWYLRIFYHLLDITVVNSWLLYRRVEAQRGDNAVTLSLTDFKIEIAQTLCKMGYQQKIGRPSKSLNSEIEVKRKKLCAASLPPKDIRVDGIGHWPEWMTKRLTCKYPNCGKLSYSKCEKCEVYLCYNKDRNCFKKFHF